MLFKKKIDLVILAGGKGTRIKKYLNGYPKPMLKFNKKFFLSYILRHSSKHNFDKIYILTGYKSNIIFKKFHNKIYNFVKVKCIKEKKEMGTGGALFKLKNKVNDFILVNGDTILDIDYSKLIKVLKKNNYGSIALVKNTNQESKKLNYLSLNNNLVKYNERSNLMNGGIYFFKKNFLKFIKNKKSSLENDILPKLIKINKINGKNFKEFFIDIGTKKYLNIASKKILDNFKRPAVFLDRDGVINYDYGYVHSIKKFRFKKGVISGLKYLSKKNYYIFIVTNQAGIGKKIFTLKEFNKLHLKLKDFFIKNEIYVNDVQYSPYHIDAKILKFKKRSAYRKPGNLMIKNIFRNWDINKKKSFMIGDKKSDYLAAQKSMLKFYFAKNDFFKQIKTII